MIDVPVTTAIKYDLHCHTTVSDGSLSPQELVQRAADKGVTHLAITDHDSVDAYRQLDQASCPVSLIPGIEFSSVWRKIGVHIVGLNIDLSSPSIAEGVRLQSDARKLRAEQIAQKLQARGLDCDLADIQALANGSQIGRPHFAQHLVNTGVVSNFQQAFKKYLGAGKPGDVKQLWADIPQIVEWIHNSGGVSVLAHPTKYKLTRTKLMALVKDFKEAGGDAMEVVSGKQIPSVTREMITICEEFGLMGSCGSDFHHPNLQWAELGDYSAVPESCPMVYSTF